MWSEKEGETEKWFIRKRKNASGGCHFVLSSPLAFGIVFNGFSNIFLKELLQCTPKDAAKVKKTRPARSVPPHIKWLYMICHSTSASLLSILSNLHLTSLFYFSTDTTEALLETTQGSTFSMSPLYIASSGKTFLLNCSRRVLGEKRNKEFIWWSVYWIKGYKHRWKLGKSSGASLLICMPCTHLTPATTSFWEPFPPSFSNMWFVQNM